MLCTIFESVVYPIDKVVRRILLLFKYGFEDLKLVYSIVDRLHMSQSLPDLLCLTRFQTVAQLLDLHLFTAEMLITR